MENSMRTQVAPNAPQSLAGVIRLVAKYPPFRSYQFGPMTETLARQLREGTNVVAIDQGRLVGYVGWVKTTREGAERWMRGEGVPGASGAEANAIVVTVLVAPERRSILPMIRMLVDLNPGVPVYRKRSFQDGRPEMKRPPIAGRGRRGGVMH